MAIIFILFCHCEEEQRSNRFYNLRLPRFARNDNALQHSNEV